MRTSAKTAHYRILARYDETKHRIHGQMHLRWTNQTRRPTSRLALRAYMNAFSRTNTAWMQETGSSFRGVPIDPNALGYLHIETLGIEDVGDAPNQWENHPPPDTQGLDWDNDTDPTILWLTLPRKIASGHSIDLHLQFTTQLPRVFARTGYAPGFVMAAQWYPKVAVYSEKGWETPPFSHHAEFFSDFADYELSIDLPAGWEMVGSGEPYTPERVPLATARRRWHHRRAQLVHDFAWSALQGGVLQSAQLQDIEIQGLLPKNHHWRDTQHLALQTELIRRSQERYGPYPWRHISFVVPPEGAAGADGMEYPTFFATEGYPQHQLPAWLYTNLYDGAWTTIHEFGHQYFQGLVANNEAQAPWLDEGLNTLTDVLLFEDIFGRNTGVFSFLGFPYPTGALLRRALYHQSINVPVDQPANAFSTHPSNYGATVYARCALAFLTLRALCEPERFDETLRQYVEHFAFSHPSSSQARAFFAQALANRCPAGPDTFLDINEYFKSTLDQAYEFDVMAKIWPPERPLSPGGWTYDPRKPKAAPEWKNSRADPALAYRQHLVLNRKGHPRLPVEYELTLANGEHKQGLWPADQSQVLHLDLPLSHWEQRVVRVNIDPEQKLLIERRKLNNLVDLPHNPLKRQTQDLRQAPMSIARALQILVGNLLP